MSVNVRALAAIRPGMPVTVLRDAMGDSWRPLSPHKGGKVDILENSLGFTARIDRNDRVGLVTYRHNFSQHVTVCGLHLGMRLGEAAIIAPSLEIGTDLAMMRGVRFGTRTGPDGSRLLVQFTLETVNKISLSNPSASYAEEGPPEYPEAFGAPGAPFADGNFKLAVLSSLLDNHAIDLGTPADLATHVLGRPVDLESEGYDLIEQARDYLFRFPLTRELLDQVSHINLDGGNAIYRYCCYFWDGEDDNFHIARLNGVENCPNLRRLSVISMTSEVDIAQLVPLHHLEDLTVDVATRNLDALLDIPALKSVRLMSNELYEQVTNSGHSTRHVMDTLKRRGVRVRVQAMSASSQPVAFE